MTGSCFHTEVQKKIKATLEKIFVVVEHMFLKVLTPNKIKIVNSEPDGVRQGSVLGPKLIHQLATTSRRGHCR